MPDLYVSSVKGAAVTRYSTMVAGKRAGLLIGAERDTKNPKQLSWNTELVVKIPAQEYAEFRKEYDKALRAKCLVPRTEQEYQAQQEALEEAAKKDAEERAKAKGEAEKQAAKATGESEQGDAPDSGDSSEEVADAGEVSAPSKPPKRRTAHRTRRVRRADPQSRPN